MRLSHLIRTITFVATALVVAACGDDGSDMAVAIIDGTPPLLTTDSNFTDGYSTTADLFVSGQVQDSNGVKSLTYKLNEESAHTLEVDTEGHFKDRILLALGSNTILLEATDNAGNIMRSTKTIYVESTYLESTVAADGLHSTALYDGQLYNIAQEDDSGQVHDQKFDNHA